MNNYEKTIETYNSVALNYENKFMQMDLYNDTYDFICDKMEKNSKILDVGCGPGNISKYLFEKRNDLKILGIDLAPNMIERAKINVAESEFIIYDALEIDKLNQKFDAIIIGFCMPYLSKEDCKTLINKTSKILNPNGLIYISTMEDDYNKSGFETTSFSDGKEVYVYYHQENLLKEELEKNDFNLIKTYKKDYPEPDGTFLTDIILIAEKE
ncbi:MAG: class I SAM-dependent methyltransferase [Flavobacteriales bacterium]|nr:class I SAM-dependent methyltransferase [Flavobacteriales bacterium]